MRTAVVAIAAALLVAATAYAASGAGKTRPALHLRAAVLHGSHFRARELVRVSVVSAGETVRRRVRASSRGTFVVAIPHGGKCVGTIHVVARGASGDSARLVLRQWTCSPLS